MGSGVITWQRRLLRVVVAASLALALTVAAATLGGSSPAVGATVAFTLKDSRITESSGLAGDPDRRIYWTVNDSGAAGAVYAVRPNGNLAGILRYRAAPIDVEAVALVKNRLYVADIGDNRARRNFVTVYFFDNPQPGQTRSYRSVDFAYPDGPHDAETLLVDRTGRLYIVTKEARGGIYLAPAQPSRQGVNRLIRVGNAPAYVTDGAFLPGGDQIALRTYLSVQLLDAQTYATVAQAPAPLQPQGESLAVTLTGTSLLLGSEGAKSKVYRVPVPKTRQSVPAPRASPPGASASPSPSRTDAADGSDSENGSEDEADAEDVARRGRQGTLLALALAGFLALVAGVIVAAVRRS